MTRRHLTLARLAIVTAVGAGIWLLLLALALVLIKPAGAVTRHSLPDPETEAFIGAAVVIGALSALAVLTQGGRMNFAPGQLYISQAVGAVRFQRIDDAGWYLFRREDESTKRERPPGMPLTLRLHPDALKRHFDPLDCPHLTDHDRRVIELGHRAVTCFCGVALPLLLLWLATQ